MKNILLLLSILLGQPVFCQTQRLGSFLNNLVAPLDKNEITTNFLWDKGLNGFTEPAIFDGIIRDSLFMQSSNFGFLYAQARNAYVGTGNNPLPHPDVYMNYVRRFTGTDTIPLAALTLQYHRIHQNALDSNWLSLQNEQLFDVPGRTQSPYWKDTLFAFCPLKSDAWHTTVYFTLPSDLVWQNMGWSNFTLQADFGAGQGWQTLTPGQTYTIEYASGGEKTVLTRMEHGSTILEGQSIIFVVDQPVQERGDGPNYPIDLPEDVLPIPGGGGDLRIFYGSPCGKLRKPFILVEGFELVDNPMQFSDRLNNLLVERKNVITGDPNLPLGEWLYAQGYDIVWVNLFNIGDYIQKNADIVKAAIQKVNEIKAANGSGHANIIMGVSAGGVITNYMFARTNVVPFDHQCEKFFTYDAPLRGANIPVSIQCFLHHANYIASTEGHDLLSGNPLIATAFNALNSPFARQTLAYRFYYPENPNSSNDGRVDDVEHLAFLAELDALGGLPIRHIALSNGSVDNTTRANILPGSRMFEVETSGSHWTWIFPTPQHPNPLPIFLEIDFNAYGNALSNTSGELVYYGNLSVKADLQPLKDFPLSVTTPDNDKGYDTAPGGSSILAMAALNGLNGTPIPDLGIPIPWIEDRWVTMSNLSITTFASHYCFVPTGSAIAAGGAAVNGPFDCGQGSSSRCTINTEETPLPTEYGVSTPEINQDHVYLDARIGDVIVDEVNQAHLIPGGLLPSSLSSYYNIGLRVQAEIPTIVISTGSGKLSINNTGFVAYATGNEPVSPLNLLRAYTKCDANITVETGAKIVAGADGAVKHGILTITDGSTLHIKSGATLQVSGEQSKLIIKHGATLILDPGAIVNLESYGSEIRIEGDLILNGDIKFEGYGYFHFANGNKLIFGPGVNNFRLTGRGLGNRFARLSADLDVEAGKGLIWKSGKVESDPGTILINTDGTCFMELVEFAGPGASQYARCVLADGANNLNFRFCNFHDITTAVSSTTSNTHTFFNCNFDHIEQAIEASGGTGGFGISACHFSNYSYKGATIAQRPFLSIASSTFESGPSALAGIDLSSIDNVTLKGSNFNGSGSNIPGPFDPNRAAEYHCGAFLDDVPLFVMRNSGMSNNGVGILAPNFITAPSNVFLLNGSFIQYSRAGVYLDGDDAEGLVLMDCASLLHNDFGVYGTDAILMIDAVNAQQHPLDGGEPNTFLRDGSGGGDTYFNICYVAKTPAQPIPMRENWWCLDDILNPQAMPENFMNIRRSNCTLPVAVNTMPPVPTPYTQCKQQEFTDSNNFMGKGQESACPLMPSGGVGDVSQSWHTAYQQLRLENFEGIRPAFQPVAALWQPDLSGFTPNCQQYIQVAKAIVDGLGMPLQEEEESAREGIEGSQSKLFANPNPATGELVVSFPDGPSTLQVFDAMGRVMYTSSPGNGTDRIAVNNWPSGIYTVLVSSEQFREYIKIVVQH